MLVTTSKSFALSFASVQPTFLREAALVIAKTPVGPVPSYWAAVGPYPAISRIVSEPTVVGVVLPLTALMALTPWTSAILPVVPLIVRAPVVAVSSPVKSAPVFDADALSRSSQYPPGGIVVAARMWTAKVPVPVADLY